MLKKNELIEPSSCLNKAHPEEPIFVLRAKDPAAPATVRLWAAMAVGIHEPEKLKEADMLASEMDAWRTEREPKPAAGSPLKAHSYIVRGEERFIGGG